MIATALGVGLAAVGLAIVLGIWKSQRRILARTASAPDRSVFSAMDLAPSVSHHFQARTSKPAETFRSFGEDFEPENRTPLLAPTGFTSSHDYDAPPPGLLSDLDRSVALPRLPLGAEEDPDDPKQESLGF